MDGLPRITILALALLSGCDERQVIDHGEACKGLIVGSIQRHTSTNELVRIQGPVRGSSDSVWVSQRGFEENVEVMCDLLSPFTEDGKPL
jgi:hypothetical protein